MSNGLLNFLKAAIGIFILDLICFPVLAQQTCATRKENGDPAFSKYALISKKEAKQREILLYCTEEEGTVKVVLRNTKTAHVLQTFRVHQSRSYLKASIPDLDSDGYSDLVLVTEWGSPNMSFTAWRYDPIVDRLKLVLEDGGTEFVRTKSGNIIVHAKGGTDSWGYTIFTWKKGELVRTYSVEETESADCKYYDLSRPLKAAQVTKASILHSLTSYCGIGGAGLIELGENLLPQ